MRTDTHKTKTQLIEELASLRQKVTEIEAEGSMRASAEQALRDGQTQLERIMSSAMDAIISVDEDQHILFFNASAERMFRCATAEALRQPLDRFIPQRFRHVHRHHVEGYCQLKPDLANWTCGAHSVFPDKSMDSLQANGVLRVGFSLS